MAAHALLSASGAKRWMTCTPSARMEEKYPDRSSASADLGTHAHKWGEMLLKHHLTKISLPDRKKEIDALCADPLHDSEVEEAVDVYIKLAKKKVQAAKKRCADPLFLIEEKFDLTDWVPEAFGTSDFTIIADGVLEVIDYKHGSNVFVEIEGNPQLRLYALGAYARYEMLYDIHTVRMTVCQPRMDNVATEELSLEELLQWAETELKPAAEVAFAGGGVLQTGDHCQFCKAQAECRAQAEMQLAVAQEAFALADPTTLSPEEIASVLEKGPGFAKWIKIVQEFALQQARDAGVYYPGFKVVEGRANRKYANEDAIIEKLLCRGFHEPDLIEVKLKGITALTKEVGKKEIDSLESLGFIVKPEGAPTLVAETDPRPEISSLEAAQQAFMEPVA